LREIAAPLSLCALLPGTFIIAPQAKQDSTNDQHAA
jgi:hypothetical protein